MPKMSWKGALDLWVILFFINWIKDIFFYLIKNWIDAKEKENIAKDHLVPKYLRKKSKNSKINKTHNYCNFKYINIFWIIYSFIVSLSYRKLQEALKKNFESKQSDESENEEA